MSTTHTKIRTAIAKVLRSGQPFTILTEKTGIGDTEVLRVITPAWSRLGKVERVSRIQDAVLPMLNPAERKRIFRFSVLTDREWNSVRTARAGGKTKVVGRRRVA